MVFRFRWAARAVVVSLRATTFSSSVTFQWRHVVAVRRARRDYRVVQSPRLGFDVKTTMTMTNNDRPVPSGFLNINHKTKPGRRRAASLFLLVFSRSRPFLSNFYRSSTSIYDYIGMLMFLSRRSDIFWFFFKSN